jgi:hypothetical protein
MGRPYGGGRIDSRWERAPLLTARSGIAAATLEDVLYFSWTSLICRLTTTAG